MVLVGHRRDLAQAGHLARDAVDVGHGEVHARFVRSCQQVQHGVGGAAHRDVERHGVFERGLVGDGARQDRVIVLLVVAARQVHDQAAGAQEQLLAVRVRGQHGAVTGQGQAQRLGQAVHRVGGKHARARTAGRTGRAFDFGDVGVGDGVVAGLDHGVHQVELDDLLAAIDHLDHFAGFHRAAGDEHHGNVDAHGSHQHARRDLVAVGDAHHRIGAVGVDHVLDRVGDQVARRQRVQHAAVAHGDAVIDRDGVEFFRNATGFFDLARYQLAQVLQVHMAGHELGEGVDDRDDRLVEVAVFHAGSAPQGARAGHVAAVGGGAGTIDWHDGSPKIRRQRSTTECLGPAGLSNIRLSRL